MKEREIQRTKERLADVGSPQDLRQEIFSLTNRLAGDLQILSTRKISVASDFRVFLSRWRTEAVPAEVVPFAVPEDVHSVKLYNLAGTIAMAAEMGLAGWIFGLRGIAWPYGAGSALAVTVILKGALHLSFFSRLDRPKEALRNLKRVAFYPSFAGFGLAAVLTGLARYVEGEAAASLVPVFTAGLWVGTVSLMLLAAALFCAAHLYGTTLRFERMFMALDHEQRATSLFLRELEQDRGGDDPQPPLAGSSVPPPTSDLPTSGVTPIGRSVASVIPLFIPIALSLLACNPSHDSSLGATGYGGVAADALVPSPARPAGTVCEVNLDISGSVVGLERAWSRLKAELPSVVIAHRCTVLDVIFFDADGWAARPQLETTLPNPPTRPSIRADAELRQFRNIDDALKAREQRDLRAAAEVYEGSVRHALQSLDAISLPDSNTESKGTDFVGVLRRYSQLSDDRSRRVIVVTDAADTHYRKFPTVPPPRGDVRLLVVLAPSKPKDALMTLGATYAASDQFVLRANAIRAAAPWAAVVPFFSDDLSGLLGEVRASGNGEL